MTDKLIAKLKNWWWYHKNLVLLAIVVIAVVIYMSFPNGGTVEPDYHIGLVTMQPYSPEQLSQMEEAFRSAGQDQNGDGQIQIQLHTYNVDLADDSAVAENNYFEIVAALDADLVGNRSGIFLLQDPEAFQHATYGILSETMIPWEQGLVLTIRSDADTAYTQLFNAFS